VLKTYKHLNLKKEKKKKKKNIIYEFIMIFVDMVFVPCTKPHGTF